MSDQRTPLLVEFVGVPCSGKSTLSRHVIAELNQHGRTPNNPTYNINNRTPAGFRPLAKLPYTAYGFGLDRSIIRDYIRSVGVRDVNPRLLFNWLFSTGVAKSYLSRPEITILDQGLVQALWSIVLSESDAAIEFFTKRLRLDYPKIPSLIVFVESSPKTVDERLQYREVNDSRVGPAATSPYSVPDAFSTLEQLSETLQQFARSRTEITLVKVENETRDQLRANTCQIVDDILSSLEKEGSDNR